MIKEAIGIAPSVEEAYKKAVTELNAPVEADIKSEILAQPTKKTFKLFGGSPAKVRAYYEIPDAKPVDSKPQKEQVKPQKNVKAPGNAEQHAKNEQKPNNNPAPAEKKPVQDKKPVPEKKPAREKTEVQNTSESEREAEQSRAANAVVQENGAPAQYLLSVLNAMGITGAAVTTSVTDEEIFLDVQTEEDFGCIIGRRGETLDALQYLVRLSVNHTDKENRRVTLNVGDYRVRRESTLKSLAKRQAARAMKIGRNVRLDPMNPYERRIVHTAVQEIEGAESFSVGEGEARHVVIAPAGGGRGYDNDRRDFNSDRGGYDRGNRGGRGGFKGGRDRRDRPAPYVPEPREPRDPKTDAGGSFRYGKIEPKKED